MAETKKTEPPRIKQGRSPAYPSIDLIEAVKRAEQVRDAGATRVEMPPETFYKIWGIGPLSSAARQTMAALNHFGLVDYVGRGNQRKVKLSELALKIVLDRQPESWERVEALGTAALSPAVHADLYEKYKSFLPADVVIQTYLTRDKGYNDEAALNLLAEYKATLAYAALIEPVKMPEDAGGGKAGELARGAKPQEGFKPPTPLPPPLKPPAPLTEGLLMEGERIVFTEEATPHQYLKLVASGEMDDFLLEALEDFVRRQRKIRAFLKRPAGEAKRPEWAGKTFRPGDVVPASMEYDVLHDGHVGKITRATFHKDSKFPPCNECTNGHVEYVPLEYPPHLD